MRSEMAERLPEPIRILSDLHLGHPACAVDDVEELRPLFEGAATVIFNGDTAELRSRSYGSRAAEDREKIRTLLGEAGVEKSVYLTGNHDPGISGRHCLALCEGKLLVTHGDFLFRYVSPWSKELRHCRPRVDEVLAKSDPVRLESDLDYRLEVTRACCEVLEVTQHQFSKTPWGLIRFLFDEFWSPTRVLTILLVWMRSAGLMAAALERYRPEARAAVFGHIHYPGIWRKRGRWIINTGGYLSMTQAKVVEVQGHQLQIRQVDRLPGGWQMRRGKKVEL